MLSWETILGLKNGFLDSSVDYLIQKAVCVDAENVRSFLHKYLHVFLGFILKLYCI